MTETQQTKVTASTDGVTIRSDYSDARAMYAITEKWRKAEYKGDLDSVEIIHYKKIKHGNKKRFFK